jgi:nucleotide-binding universal stress UspA family protein
VTVDKQYEVASKDEKANLEPTEESDVTADKQYEVASKDEKANLEPTEESDVTYEVPSSISKENLPSFGNILITDDGKDESNKAFNYAVTLSRYSGAELVILRILEDFEKVEGVSVQGVNQDNKTTNMDIKQEVKGQVIDEMEIKLKRCKEAGCEGKISYKFKVGNAIEEIVNEIKQGNYDLLVLRSTHLDSWMKSLFSDARKIIGNIEIPVLIIQ